MPWTLINQLEFAIISLHSFPYMIFQRMNIRCMREKRPACLDCYDLSYIERTQSTAKTKKSIDLSEA